MMINLRPLTIKAITKIPEIYKQHDMVLKYHNSDHIHDLINKFFNTDYNNRIASENFDDFIYAIIYHDSVYNIQNLVYNEENSYEKFLESEFALDMVRLNHISRYDYIKEIILSTKRGAVCNSIASQVMHDLDYSMFACSNRYDYIKTAFNIYDEFYNVYKSHIDLVPKRIEFLEEVNSSKIFYFDDVYDEKYAHDNIEYEIDIWKTVFNKRKFK